jgi:hypothetical protein
MCSLSSPAVDSVAGKRILYKHPRSRFIAWPKDWTERHYNGTHDPCDMLIGFCSCGAAHYEEEEWVQAALRYYGAEISDQPRPVECEAPDPRYATSLSYF